MASAAAMPTLTLAPSPRLQRMMALAQQAQVKVQRSKEVLHIYTEQLLVQQERHAEDVAHHEALKAACTTLKAAEAAANRGLIMADAANRTQRVPPAGQEQLAPVSDGTNTLSDRSVRTHLSLAAAATAAAVSAAPAVSSEAAHRVATGTNADMNIGSPRAERGVAARGPFVARSELICGISTRSSTRNSHKRTLE